MSLRNPGRKGVVYKALAGAAPVVETGVAWRRTGSTPAALRFVDFMTAAPWSATGSAAAAAGATAGATAAAAAMRVSE